MIRFTADSIDQHKRLDVLVTEKIKGASRAFTQDLIQTGKVTVNSLKEKSSYRIKIGDKIKIDFTPGTVEVPIIDIPIIYEDKDCVVIDKPVGILSHNKGDFNPEATVATWLSPRVRGLKGNRAGIVHRLDRATSGVMITAKHPEAQKWLQKQFAQHKVKKTYLAVVKGKLDPPEAIIDMPIQRNPKKPQTFRVNAKGKPAVTAYKTIKSSDKYSLVKLKPQTGRTHQLRVHLKHLGHPILGDVLYGTDEADRLYLHSYSLEITLPNKNRKIFTYALPIEFKKWIK